MTDICVRQMTNKSGNDKTRNSSRRICQGHQCDIDVIGKNPQYIPAMNIVPRVIRATAAWRLHPAKLTPNTKPEEAILNKLTPIKQAAGNKDAVWTIQIEHVDNDQNQI